MSSIPVCGPDCKHPDEPHEFFVSCIRAQETALLMGPYAKHQDAIDAVPRARELAYKADPWTWFDRFGTVAVKPGNKGAFGT